MVAAARARAGSLVMSDGATIHYLESGTPTGASLVLVPGWTMPGWIWEDQMHRLGGRHRVVAIDPRAQGESPWAAGMDLSPPRRSRDVAEVVNALKLDHPVLIGWSLGAVEVARCAAALPAGRVRGLILVDQPLYDEAAGRDARGRFRRQLRANRPAVVERFVRGMFLRPVPRAWLDRLTRAALHVPLEAGLTLLGGEPGDLAALVAGVPEPVMIIMTPRLHLQAERFHREQPRARVEMLPNAGHAMFVDAPDRFVELVESFVAGVAP